MNIKTLKVKQYCSTYKFIILVDDEPVAITKSEKTAGLVESYLRGYDVKITDGKIKKTLDKLRVSNKKGSKK